MAGYACDFSKSNNAIEAEERGCYPLTKASDVVAKKFKITKAFAKYVLNEMGSCEWHHSSKFYNEVEYFNTNEVTQEFIDSMREPYEVEKPKKESEKNLGICDVLYLEWSGSRSRPKSKEIKITATVKLKGKFYTITLENGESFKKKVDCHGLFVKQKAC